MTQQAKKTSLTPWQTTKKIIFGNPEFLEAAFIMGVAHSHGKLPKACLEPWLEFMWRRLPTIHQADTLSSGEYQLICHYIDTVTNFAKTFKSTKEHLVKAAEAAAPKETWVIPEGFESWRQRQQRDA